MQPSETKSIQVVIYGEPRNSPAGFTAHRLLECFKTDVSRVVIEIDREIAREPDRAASEAQPDALIEVLCFVGEGAR